MRKFLKEPLVHFIGLGLLLFLANALWERNVQKADYTITVEPGELERQALIFTSENRRQPTDEDLQALLFSYVEEEVLLREAQRLGLGEDDTIIRRRLAQKMRFLIEDTGDTNPPNEATLKEWFKTNQAKFVKPEMRSFSHIFLSPEKHGDQLSSDAQALLAQVNDENWKSLGDPFMLNRSYERIDQQAIERLLGASFSTELFAAEGEQWQGPIGSAFGLHLVRISEIQPETQPSFDSVRDQVVLAWRDSNRRSENNQRLRDLISKYKIEVEDGE